jgi:hypothetical protein
LDEPPEQTKGNMKTNQTKKKPPFQTRVEMPDLASAYVERRLAELRTALRSEVISYGELQELQSLAKHIKPEDVELLKATGQS